MNRLEIDEFGKLVEEHQAAVFNLCYRMLGDRGAAEDAAQEAFIKAYQAQDRYDPERPFRTWVMSIAAHHCIDLLRKRRLQWLSLDVLDYLTVDRRQGAPERELESKQEKQVIQSLLAELSAVDRAAIVLRYWYEMSNAEISEALELSSASVRTRLHRARKQLALSWHETRGATVLKEASREPSTA